MGDNIASWAPIVTLAEPGKPAVHSLGGVQLQRFDELWVRRGGCTAETCSYLEVNGMPCVCLSDGVVAVASRLSFGFMWAGTPKREVSSG